MARDETAGTLVVGAGQAAISLVTALRELGDTEPIVLVGDEPDAPYERPPLSKSYLRGEHDRASLVFHDAAWFADLGVELVTGDAVAAIERDARGGRAVTASGRALGFDRLALTHGRRQPGAPRRRRRARPGPLGAHPGRRRPAGAPAPRRRARSSSSGVASSGSRSPRAPARSAPR